MLLFVKQIHRTIIVQTFQEHHVFTLQQDICLYKLVVKFFLQASSGFLFIANGIEKRCNAWIQTETPCELVHFCGDVKKEKCTY